MSKNNLGASIAEGKHPIPSRTRQLSPLAAKVVPGRLGVRIARCTLYFKATFRSGFFIFATFFFNLILNSSLFLFPRWRGNLLL